jgi:hypothetical protein
MSRAVFMAAIEQAVEYDYYIALGGGEPTYHPEFFDFLSYALCHIEKEECIWIATNGKAKTKALKLLNMAKREGFCLDLSQDRFHEPISMEVVHAYEEATKRHENICIRNTFESRGAVIAHGRATSLASDLLRNDCICNSIFVQPSGVVKACGCDNSPVIGHVQAEIDLDCYERWEEEMHPYLLKRSNR